jgi:hypothetical protein
MFLEEMADAIAAGRAGVPDVVLAAVEARFDCLSPEVRRVLRAASLYGDKFFSAEALVAVLGDASHREMGEWLENLVMRDLVQRQANGGEVACSAGGWHARGCRAPGARCPTTSAHRRRRPTGGRPREVSRPDTGTATGSGAEPGSGPRASASGPRPRREKFQAGHSSLCRRRALW